MSVYHSGYMRVKSSLRFHPALIFNFWHNFSSSHITVPVYPISVFQTTAPAGIRMTLWRSSTPHTFSRQVSHLISLLKSMFKPALVLKIGFDRSVIASVSKANYLSRVYCLLQHYKQIKYLLSLIFNVTCMTWYSNILKHFQYICISWKLNGSKNLA